MLGGGDDGSLVKLCVARMGCVWAVGAAAVEGGKAKEGGKWCNSFGRNSTCPIDEPLIGRIF